MIVEIARSDFSHLIKKDVDSLNIYFDESLQKVVLKLETKDSFISSILSEIEFFKVYDNGKLMTFYEESTIKLMIKVLTEKYKTRCEVND